MRKIERMTPIPAETEEKEGRQKCVFACVYSDFFRNTDFSSADSER